MDITGIFTSYKALAQVSSCTQRVREIVTDLLLSSSCKLKGNKSGFVSSFIVRPFLVIGEKIVSVNNVLFISYLQMNLVMSINSVSIIWVSLAEVTYPGHGYKINTAAACAVSTTQSQFICNVLDVHLCLVCSLHIYKHTQVSLLAKIFAGILRIALARIKYVERKASSFSYT